MADDELYIELFIENEQLHKRIAELEAALREALDYIDVCNDLAIHIGKILEKKDVYV